MSELMVEWRIHTPNLLKEVLKNKGAEILNIPINIFGKVLFNVADCASRLNDPELNALMCQLTLYAISDPESEYYDKKLHEKTINYKELTK